VNSWIESDEVVNAETKKKSHPEEALLYFSKNSMSRRPKGIL